MHFTDRQIQIVHNNKVIGEINHCIVLPNGDLECTHALIRSGHEDLINEPLDIVIISQEREYFEDGNFSPALGVPSVAVYSNRLLKGTISAIFSLGTAFDSCRLESAR